MERINTISAAALVAAALISTGCNRDEVTRSAPAPSAPTAPGAPAMPGGMPSGQPSGMPGEQSSGQPGGMPQGSVPNPPAPSTPLKWSLPKGWTSTPGNGMRFATLNPPGGKAELSVVCLPGSAGGELANVNRWRGQIGLPPVDDAALAKARQTVKSKAGAVTVFDFTSEGQSPSRMVAGTLVTQDGNTWFLKLVGDAAAVGKVRPDYTRILETLHLD